MVTSSLFAAIAGFISACDLLKQMTELSSVSNAIVTAYYNLSQLIACFHMEGNISVYVMRWMEIQWLSIKLG